jgi:hypothetical protein
MAVTPKAEYNSALRTRVFSADYFPLDKTDRQQ